MCIGETIFKSWMQGDLTRAEELLTQSAIAPSNTLYHAHTLAHRALVRARSKRWGMAIGDAKEVSSGNLAFYVLFTIVRQSIKVQRSVIGYIAHAITLIGNGERESALRAFDLVFTGGLPSENKFLLLIRVCASCCCWCRCRLFVSFRPLSCLNAENMMMLSYV